MITPAPSSSDGRREGTSASQRPSPRVGSTIESGLDAAAAPTSDTAANTPSVAMDGVAAGCTRCRVGGSGSTRAVAARERYALGLGGRPTPKHAQTEENLPALAPATARWKEAGETNLGAPSSDTTTEWSGSTRRAADGLSE